MMIVAIYLLSLLVIARRPMVPEQFAVKTMYSGSEGNCSRDIIGIENITLDVCITDSAQTSTIIECVGGYYLRNKIFNTSDCTGDHINCYDGLDQDACYDINCSHYMACDCEGSPCDEKCTDRSDARCSGDCCAAIWYDVHC